tara:strand:- start:429 stop:1145 length:717 start_codon:yes stop_codon:yes gene_type:complete
VDRSGLNGDDLQKTGKGHVMGVQAEVDPDSYIVGLGHPRCGTLFSTNLIRTCGLDVGHERKGADGLVSWTLLGEREKVPWGHGLGPLAPFKRIFCAARSPLAAIPSIVPENRRPRSIKYRNRILLTKSGKYLQYVDNPVALALESYTRWFALALNHNPGVIFRIDRPEDDAALSDFVGQPLKRAAEIHTHARPKIRFDAFSLEMLTDVPVGVITQTLTMAERLGYPEDAETIREICGI